MHIQIILMFVCTLKSAELHDVNYLNELTKLAHNVYTVRFILEVFIETVG